MNKILSLIFLALIPLCASATGCGNDSDNGVTASALTKTQYLKKAGKLCEEGNQQRFAAVEAVTRKREAQKESIGPEDLEDLTTEIMLPRIKSLADELAGLGAPAGDEEAIESILEHLDDRIEVAEDEPKRFIKGDLFSEVNKAFASYGLDGCSV